MRRRRRRTRTRTAFDLLDLAFDLLDLALLIRGSNPILGGTRIILVAPQESRGVRRDASSLAPSRVRPRRARAHVRRVGARVFRAHAHDAIVAVGAQREGARAAATSDVNPKPAPSSTTVLPAPPRARVVNVADAQRRGGVLAQGGERARLCHASRVAFAAVPHRGQWPLPPDSSQPWVMVSSTFRSGYAKTRFGVRRRSIGVSGVLRGKSASAVESVGGNPSDGPPPPLLRSGEARGGRRARLSWTRRNRGRARTSTVTPAEGRCDASPSPRARRRVMLAASDTFARVLTRRPAGVIVG